MNDTTVSDLFLSRIESFRLTEDAVFRAKKFVDRYVVVHFAEFSPGHFSESALQEDGSWSPLQPYSSSVPFGENPKLFLTIQAIPEGYRDF